MKSIKIFSCLLAGLLMLAACQKNDVKVYASFTTDKDVYQINEDIYLTNTSYSENARIVACKWEWGNEHVWGLNPEKPISFPTVGEYDITLTASVESGQVSSTFTKTVTVVDTNIRPIADFTWEPQTGLKAGDTVKFTDRSSDADGQVVAWEWQFGSTIVNDRNPEYTFTQFGDIPVTLTVTDNQKGTGSKTVMIHFDKTIYSLELMWEKVYDTTGDSYVKFTAPATNADGSAIYAFSSGYQLAAFDKDGNSLWTFDATKHNPNATDKNGTKRTGSCVPSVDSEGNVFVAVGYNESARTAAHGYDSGVYSVSSTGSENWYFTFERGQYMAPIPVILGDEIILTTKANPNNYSVLKEKYGTMNNGHIISRLDGSYIKTLTVKQGAYGGVVGIKSGKLVCHCNTAFGSNLWFKTNDENLWRMYGSTNQDKKALGFGYWDTSKNNGVCETPNSSQMAVDPDERVYILYHNNLNKVSTLSALYCYDTKAYVQDTATEAVPEWICPINGSTACYEGLGVIIGEDGVIYTTTKTAGDVKARVTAVSKDGNVLWESLADGDISASAAIDNEGYIYYNDYSIGKLVKLEPTQGKKVAEIQLADELRSSPTISCDGGIYCVGMKNGAPTLFCVRGSATGHANSWSQLGGNPSKTCVLY